MAGMHHLSDIEIKRVAARDKPWRLSDGGGLYVLVGDEVLRKVGWQCVP